ncbi:MAG: hypothetical protein JNN17_15250 [Verrucomicrobiaceae bacterium]|nr:hypothetical protein [Verrucomicrobiaceae bacterium]
MNSKPITETWYTLRLARWAWRLIWNRRMAWTVVCLVSLVTVLWQWENWRSARELKAVHQRVVERLGTDDPFAFMPPRVTDEQNYFANPVLESWLHETTPGTLRLKYNPPKDALLPKDFIKPEIVEGEDGKAGRLDLKAWMAKRNLPNTEEPRLVLARELGDGNGLLPKLAEGLNKPYSIMKPGQREAMEAADGNPWAAPYPQFESLNRFQEQLGLHLRSAALAGEGDKAATIAHIMLRFCEAPARCGMIGCLVPLALHGIALDALHEALEHPVWTEEALGRLQVRLAQFDDLKQYQRAHAGEILNMFAGLTYFRRHPEAFDLGGGSDAERSVTGFVVRNMPVGWHDANVAYYTNHMLDQLGPLTPTAWLDAGSRSEAVNARVKAEVTWPNPRRILGAIAIPHVGNISQHAAETLFHRRCLIIACALEKHRLRHGAFPASLDTVKDDLKLFTLDDPAWPGHLPGFKLENGGYLLWSAGPDARDDGGEKDKDWLWRVTFSLPNPA